MAGIRLSDSENNTVLRALSLYLWYCTRPEEERVNYPHTLPKTEQDDELIRARQVYERAYQKMCQNAGY